MFTIPLHMQMEGDQHDVLSITLAFEQNKLSQYKYKYKNRASRFQECQKLKKFRVPVVKRGQNPCWHHCKFTFFRSVSFT